MLVSKCQLSGHELEPIGKGSSNGEAAGAAFVGEQLGSPLQQQQRSSYTKGAAWSSSNNSSTAVDKVPLHCKN